MHVKEGKASPSSLKGDKTKSLEYLSLDMTSGDHSTEMVF